MLQPNGAVLNFHLTEQTKINLCSSKSMWTITLVILRGVLLCLIDVDHYIGNIEGCFVVFNRCGSLHW